MVGAVVVHKGRIIGEDFTGNGEAHAEVNAIASVKDESLLKDSTIYVSLEPCSHYGEDASLRRVDYPERDSTGGGGCLDPFPEVSGRGVRMLREAGRGRHRRDGGSPCVEQGVYDATNESLSLYLEMGRRARMGLSIVCVRTCRSRSRFCLPRDFPLGA